MRRLRGFSSAFSQRNLRTSPPRGIHALYAPDVVQGPDERYYLYYCLDFLSEIGVAVCDTPCGAYEYLGRVRHADGTPLGARQGDLTQFDPGVFVDEDKQVYLYSGNAPMRPERTRLRPVSPSDKIPSQDGAAHPRSLRAGALRLRGRRRGQHCACRPRPYHSHCAVYFSDFSPAHDPRGGIRREPGRRHSDRPACGRHNQ